MDSQVKFGRPQNISGVSQKNKIAADRQQKEKKKNRSWFGSTAHQAYSKSLEAQRSQFDLKKFLFSSFLKLKHELNRQTSTVASAANWKKYREAIGITATVLKNAGLKLVHELDCTSTIYTTLIQINVGSRGFRRVISCRTCEVFFGFFFFCFRACHTHEVNLAEKHTDKQSDGVSLLVFTKLVPHEVIIKISWLEKSSWELQRNVFLYIRTAALWWDGTQR